MRPDYHDATAKEFLSEKDADYYHARLRYQLLCDNPILRAETIADHYLKLVSLAMRLDKLIRLYKYDRSPEIEEVISRTVEIFSEVHVKDFGIELKWGGGETDKP